LIIDKFWRRLVTTRKESLMANKEQGKNKDKDKMKKKKEKDKKK
jgi:hypothetical protein